MTTAPDVVVVGAGVIGLSVAWRAAQAGLRVTVCDPDPGRGASWAAAGMLAPVTEATMADGPLTALGLASMALWPGFADDLGQASGIDPGLRCEGTLVVAFGGDDRRLLDELLQVQRLLGLDSEWLDSSACRKLEPLLSPRVRGGLGVPGDWQVDNRALLAALAEAGRRSGVQLVQDAVQGLRCNDQRVEGVDLDGGRAIPAKAVVLAAGAWSSRLPGLPGAAKPPVRPVKGDIVRLAGPAADPVLNRTIRASVHGRSVYMVPRHNGQIVVGASMEEAGFVASVRTGAVSDLLADAIAVVPALAELEFVEATARLRPGTPDNGPILGPSALAGLFLATGHHRNGVLLAPVTAQALVSVLTGGSLAASAAGFTMERFG